MPSSSNPQAKEAEYSSNAHLWVEIAMELYQETEAIVKSVMTSLISTWMNEGRYKMSTRKPRGLATWMNRKNKYEKR